MGQRPSERLAERGIQLPSPPPPAGTYLPVVVQGTSAWVSGQIASLGGRILTPGLVDRDVPLEAARQAARQATLQGLGALAQALGSLDRVRRVVRLGVYVASSPGFVEQHRVGDGASELLTEVFGEAVRPARVSMGVAALPLGAPVEVELLAALEE